MRITQLVPDDAADLVDFYFRGLSLKSRRFFGSPYPLFNVVSSSPDEMHHRIQEWKKGNDWTFLNLWMAELLVGIVFLKLYHSDYPRTGIAVRDDYHRLGLGLLLQSFITEEARLLGLARYYAAVLPNNTASIKMHEKAGLRRTGEIVAGGIEFVMEVTA